MTSRVSTGKSATRSSIKKKQTVTHVQEEEQNYTFINKELTRGLTDAEVEIEHLKTTIIALNEKAESLNDMKTDVQSHKDMLRQSEQSRDDLQNHMKETSDKIQKDTQNHKAYQSELLDQIQDLKNQIEKLKQIQAQKDQEHQREVEQLNNQREGIIDDHTNKSKNQNDKINNERQQQQELHNKQIRELIDQHNKERDQQANNHNAEISRLVKAHNKEKSELLDKTNKVTTDLVSQHSQDRGALVISYNVRMALMQKAHNATMKVLREQKDALLRQKDKDKEEMRKQYENQLNNMDQKIKTQSQKILELDSTIIETKELLRQKVDVEDQIKMARQHIQGMDQQKMQLQKELETASDYILELEDKVYKANKTSLELLKQLKDAEVEIETLKNYIIDLKQRIAVYIPVKDDPIDNKLAEFINNYPDRQRLKIMFMRESEGVYQFGTKRVAVRVEKDKINIRVGGGYLSIDEFLDQYTPGELEKLERKDPLRKFSQKVAMQKTIVGKEVRESSPIRGSSPNRASMSPGKSPQK